MKTRILLSLLVAMTIVAIASGSGTALADGGKDKGKKPKTEVEERVVDQTPVFSDEGQFVGFITTVVGSEVEEPPNEETPTSTVAAAYYTRSKTCYTRQWMTNWWGMKLWQLTLRQTWGYTGSRIVWAARPDVSAWSRAGWSHTSPRSGVYWTQWPRYARTWASSTLTFKIGWYTVQSRTASLYFNINYNGQCYY